MKDFNILIDGKSFFDLTIKNEEEAYEKIIEMRVTKMITRLLTYYILVIIKKNYQLIAIDLSKQTKLKDPLLEKLRDKIIVSQWFLLLKGQKKLLLNFRKIL